MLGAVASNSLGSAVANSGDINTDGFGDLIIGESLGDPLSRTNAGASYVIFGHTGNFSDIDLSTTTLCSTGQGFQVISRLKSFECIDIEAVLSFLVIR